MTRSATTKFFFLTYFNEQLFGNYSKYKRVPNAVSIIKNFYTRAVESLRKKSSMWIPAGFFMYGTGRIVTAQNTNMPAYLVDVAASCINLRAEVRSAVDVTFTGGGGAEKTVKGMFFRSRDISTHGEFLSLISQDCDTHGNSFWYLDLAAQEFRRWDPQFVVINLENGSIVNYQRKTDDPKVARNLVFHFKRTSNLNHAIVGRSILDEVAALLKCSFELNGYFARYLETDCMPTAAVEFPKDSILTPEQIGQMKEDYKQNFMKNNRSQNLAFIAGGGKLSSPVKHEFDFIKSYDMIGQAIRDIFGCPKVAFGNTDHVNFSNGLTSFLMFIELRVNLFHARVSDELTYFFNSNKIYVSVTYKSRINTSSLSGLASSPVGVQESATS